MEHGKRYSVRFPLDLLQAVKQFAQEDKRSINGEIVWIVEQYVKQRKRGKRDKELQVPPLSERDH
jgi:hypothetical protein